MDAQAQHESAILESNEAYKKIIRILSNGLRMTVPAGNQRGDRFYLRLVHKRKNGKWRVSGPAKFRTPTPSTSTLIKSTV